MSLKAKVIVIGPNKSGKTALSNLWADVAAASAPGAQRRPTQGCRILEFEADAQGGQRSDLTVELWDVSGDRTFESCWPAIGINAHAAIVVVDANNIPSAEELEPWFKRLVKGAGIKSSQCIAVALRIQKGASLPDDIVLPGPLGKAKLVIGDVEEDPEDLRRELNKFLVHVRSAAIKSRDQEEATMMGGTR